MTGATLQDEWTTAAAAFRHGARARARSALRNALDETPLSCALLRSVLQVNGHATQISPGKGQAIPSPPQVSPPRDAHIAIRLLAGETALTAAYNKTLAQLRGRQRGEGSVSVNCLERALVHVPRLLLDAYRSNDAEHSVRGQRSWGAVATIADAVRLDEEQLGRLDRTDANGARRFAEAAAAALELRSAAALCEADLETATDAAQAAQALRRLAVAELNRCIPTDDKPMCHGSMGYSHPSSQDFIAEADSGEADDPSMSESQTPDQTAARVDWLTGLAKAMGGDREAALEAVLERGRELEISAGVDSIERHHLPSVYMAGALLVNRGGREEDRERATCMLEACAARGFRAPDCLALVARVETRGQGVSGWQRVVALDVQRPAALWLAAKEFQQCGKATQQAELLRCLEEVLSSCQKAEQDTRPGTISIHGTKATAGEYLTLAKVRLARASGLCSVEQWDEADEVLRRVPRRSNQGDDEIEVEEGEGAMLAALRGWAELGMGNVEEGLTLAELAVNATSNASPWASCAHAGRAEALMRIERVMEACEAILAGFRAASGASIDSGRVEYMLLRGVFFHNLGIARYCLSREGIADECFAGAQSAFEKCASEATAPGLREAARAFTICTSFARCIAMWTQGRKVDAAGHWRVKRGEVPSSANRLDSNMPGHSSASNVKCIKSHLKNAVDPMTLIKMDEICEQVCRNEEARRRLAKMMEDVQRDWQPSHEH